MINPTTQITYEEAMNAWAPLTDLSMQFDRILARTCDDARGSIELMDDKVKRALEPLEKLIDRIEEENPSSFGRLNG